MIIQLWRSNMVLFACGLLIFWVIPVHAQTEPVADSVLLESIHITGNNKTMPAYILREIPFKQGDSLSRLQLATLMEQARINIFNTKLFITVDVDYSVSPSRIVVMNIIVSERWYMFPIPYAEFADRSFNVWWYKQHRSLKRLSYGINFFQQNLTGRNDNLDMILTAGFNRQINVEYTTPYLTSGMKSRIKAGLSYLRSREIPYLTTDSNRLLYYQSDQTIRRNWKASLSYELRRGIRATQWFTFSLGQVNLFDSLKIINPQYFKENATNIMIPELGYRLRYDLVDNVFYPLAGERYQFLLSKRGMGWSGGADRLYTKLYTQYYKSLGNEWFASFRFTGQVMLPFDQPYYNTQAIGYGYDYLRGYEFYVMDGVASFIARADIKRKLFHFDIPTGISSKDYAKIPFTVYAKAFTDIGSSYNRIKSYYGNKLQAGLGIGLDVVTIYDVAISLNLTFNRLGDAGFYYHQE